MHRLAIFDLDGTLVPRHEYFRRWAEQFADERHLGPEAARWLCVADEDGLASREALMTDARRRFGLPEPVDDLLAAYWPAYLRHFEPDPAVLEPLGRLRAADWLVGIATNGPATQYEKIERSGLSGMVDGCCASLEIGRHKPDPAVFTEVARRCGCDLGALQGGWMVGDAPLADIGGGRGVGLQTIWLHRGRQWEEPDFRPDAVVATVGRAVDLILAA